MNITVYFRSAHWITMTHFDRPRSSSSEVSQKSMEAMTSDQEKGLPPFHDSDSKLETSDEPLKLDRYGLPLQPQPSKFSDDPLVSNNKCDFLYLYDQGARVLA